MKSDKLVDWAMHGIRGAAFGALVFFAIFFATFIWMYLVSKFHFFIGTLLTFAVLGFIAEAGRWTRKAPKRRRR